MERKPLSETHPHLREFTAFLDVLNKESDRGAVLISLAMLDDLLEHTILSFLIETNEAEKLTDGFNAPLGTLSARALAAYSLGLISKEEYQDCDRLRRIRNEFAHNVHFSFDDQKVKDICANLQFSAKGLDSAKALFSTAATGLILTLTNRPAYVALKRRTYQPWPY
jgi:mannitol operon repressor